MSAYEEHSGSDQGVRLETLEQAGAMWLGLMLFAFSRLDMNLGLSLVAAEGAEQAEARKPRYARMPFAQKLNDLRALVGRMPVGDTRSDWLEWVGRCDASDLLRRDAAHGHWIPDVRAGAVVSVVSLPDGKQEQVPYSPADLEAAAQEFGELLTELARLRRIAPPGG